MASHSRGNSTQRRKIKARDNGKFFIPKTRQQFRTCIQRMTLQLFNIAFQLADKAMYVLGPILITLASALIVGLTYVYFRVILPMLAGTNWVFTNEDWGLYWSNRGYGGQENGEEASDGSVPISLISSIFLALSTPTGILHTLLVAFFLINIFYNYYQCVKTSNSGPRYDLVVRELAQVTGFCYPETEVELVHCKKDFERKIYEKVKRRRNEMLAGSHASTSNNSATSTAGLLGSRTPANNMRNGDEESPKTQSSLIANETTNASKTSSAVSTKKTVAQKLPTIHNWQLLSPIEWGYCRFSSQPKPPRSHYDHVTKALVLNMDHYCPWMFNCIGYFNYRYFFNFLWFVTTALCYGTAICIPAFMKIGGKEYRDQVRASWGSLKPLKDTFVKHNRSNPFIPTPDERTPVALGFMLCLCLGVAVMCLGSFHLYLMLSAQTTIEFHGNFSKRKRGGWKNPYSAGSRKRNWEMIYGTRYWSKQSSITSVRNSDEKDQYRYHGCWGVLMAMMPSNREPEFLPIPIDGFLVRRKNQDIPENDGEMDVEMARSEQRSNGEELPVAMEKTEFLMESNDPNGQMVGRTRANISKKEEISL